jgi:hypothetical protein
VCLKPHGVDTISRHESCHAGCTRRVGSADSPTCPVVGRRERPASRRSSGSTSARAAPTSRPRSRGRDSSSRPARQARRAAVSRAATLTGLGVSRRRARARRMYRRS